MLPILKQPIISKINKTKTILKSRLKESLHHHWHTSSAMVIGLCVNQYWLINPLAWTQPVLSMTSWLNHDASTENLMKWNRWNQKSFAGDRWTRSEVTAGGGAHRARTRWPLPPLGMVNKLAHTFDSNVCKNPQWFGLMWVKWCN